LGKPIVSRQLSVIVAVSLTALAGCLLSCATGNPNLARILTSITVTPATANAEDFPNGQVVFTAAGTFNVSPTPAPVSSNPPYAGQFVVDNPVTGPIANVIATGNGTATVQCVAGTTGTVDITMSAFANNGTSIIVTGSAALTCP
jgi:hypothetical protein